MCIILTCENSSAYCYSCHYQELENTNQVAVAAVENGTGSIELLHRQLVAQMNEQKEAKRLHRLG
jgi:hypothetical protein